MKSILSITLIFLIFVQACQQNLDSEELNQFTTTTDTLLIRTTKTKGAGLFSLGVGTISFRDSAEAFQYPLVFPANISNIKGIQIGTDLYSKTPDYIDIVSGLIDNEQVFIVDQNNNKDFTDDTVRQLKPIEWYSSENSIKVSYKMYDGQKIVRDSSWIKIGTQNGRLLYGRDEHLKADLHLNGESYLIGIMDQWSSMMFNYSERSEVALFSDMTITKDTLLKRDLIKMGEYLNLGDSYFRLDKISNNGDYMVLIKEPNFQNTIGTQVGMLAPDFKAISIDGDTVNSDALHDKPIVLANSCGCGGDTQSTEAFYEIKDALGKQVHILRLDSGIEESESGWHIDMEDDYNKEIYNNYRGEYCSRIGYVIGTDQRLIEKFEIKSWQSFLPNLVVSTSNEDLNRLKVLLE